MRNRMNAFGHSRRAFFFMTDFLLSEFLLIPLDALPLPGIAFRIGEHHSEPTESVLSDKPYIFDFQAIPFDVYQQQFAQVMAEIQAGNTYLINLTCSTPIQTNLSLYDFYQLSTAPYRVWMQDAFTVFSPESFVRIEDGRISTYPMKGTIDANIPDARERILADEKELAEHYTIVDLLRNDLSMVSTGVRVEAFRYTEYLQTIRKPLIQVSSRISGQLPADYRARLGDIMFALLPAGSISGAPKQKTVEILVSVEHHQRHFYTGIAGVFDGNNLDSGVLIRYIEQGQDGLVFKSGGGITFRSDAASEYQEMLDKVYFPTSHQLTVIS